MAGEHASFHVRVHGRGGQGVVTAAEMLSVAAFLDGSYSQALPSFGSERMGAPVVAFCRIDNRPIRSHDQAGTVDALVIQDPTLLHEVDLFAGLWDGSYVLINSTHQPHQLGLEDIARRLPGGHTVTVAATALARQHIGRALPNTALLGGLASLTGVVSLGSVQAAIRRRFAGALGDANVTAATAAYQAVGAEQEASGVD